MSTNQNSADTSNTNSGNNKGGNVFSTIVKIVVIAIVVLLIIYFCYKIVTDFISTNNNSPYFIQSIADGNTPLLVSGDKLPPSEDAKFGTEFTYSFWIYVKDSNFTTSSGSSSSSCSVNSPMKNIFVKGSTDYSSDHLPLLQAPGVWLYPDDNKMAIFMIHSIFTLKDVILVTIPVNKWVHITIMLIGHSLDVYVNCNLKKRCKLSGVPKQNYEDLRISYWGGFNGYLSRFRYYNYALEPYQISQICGIGPASTDELTNNQTAPPYLAKDYWTTTGFPKAQNP